MLRVCVCVRCCLRLGALTARRRMPQVFAARALHQLLRCSVSKAAKKQASHLVLTDAEWAAARDALAGVARRWATHASAPGAASVLTQLALALSALLIKWPALPASELLPHALACLSGDVVCSLHLLRLLPEEARHQALSVHPDRRSDVLAALRAGAGRVLDSLAVAAAAAAANETHTQALALDAFAAWCDFGAPPEAVAKCALTDAAFGVLCCCEPMALLQPACTAACAAAASLAPTHARRLAQLLAGVRHAAAHAPCDARHACTLLSVAAAEDDPARRDGRRRCGRRLSRGGQRAS